jgi:hypothetical protein
MTLHVQDASTLVSLFIHGITASGAGGGRRGAVVSGAARADWRWLVGIDRGRCIIAAEHAGLWSLLLRLGGRLRLRGR